MKTTRHDISKYYSIEALDPSFKQIVPKRRAPVRPIDGLTVHDANEMKKRAFDNWGDLKQYNECWTFEMGKRPIPFVSTDPRPLKVQSLFMKYIQAVFDVLLPTITASTQTYNKVSRLGAPIYANPTDGAGNLVKMKFINELFAQLEHGDVSAFKGAGHTIGIRLQNEPPSKTREMAFIDADGNAYMEEIDRRRFAERLPDLGTMIPPRSRTVVSPSVINLYLQPWDTMLHRAIMRHPLCDANVYTKEVLPEVTNFASFDCKHYERDLGLLVFPYANTVGGLYGEWLTRLVNDPYFVPSDDWQRVYKVTPLYGPGVHPQFGSGLCCVSTLGKLANICVRVSYYVDQYNMDAHSAVMTALSGQHDGLRHWMYGDDNRIHGEPEKRNRFIEYMGDYFHVEQDEVPTFLGTILRPDVRRFVLTANTYNLKLYLPERDFSFKTFPNLGYYERRNTFSSFGEPEITTDIIPLENQLLDEVGYPWLEIVQKAMIEKAEAMKAGLKLSAEAVTDKEYLMTPEQQLDSGLFWGIQPDRVRTIILQLVGNDTKAKLKL